MSSFLKTTEGKITISAVATIVAIILTILIYFGIRKKKNNNEEKKKDDKNKEEEKAEKKQISPTIEERKIQNKPKNKNKEPINIIDKKKKIAQEMQPITSQEKILEEQQEEGKEEQNNNQQENDDISNIEEAFFGGNNEDEEKKEEEKKEEEKKEEEKKEEEEIIEKDMNIIRNINLLSKKILFMLKDINCSCAKENCFYTFKSHSDYSGRITYDIMKIENGVSSRVGIFSLSFVDGEKGFYNVVPMISCEQPQSDKGAMIKDLDLKDFCFKKSKGEIGLFDKFTIDKDNITNSYKYVFFLQDLLFHDGEKGKNLGITAPNIYEDKCNDDYSKCTDKNNLDKVFGFISNCFGPDGSMINNSMTYDLWKVRALLYGGCKEDDVVTLGSDEKKVAGFFDKESIFEAVNNWKNRGDHECPLEDVIQDKNNENEFNTSNTHKEEEKEK